MTDRRFLVPATLALTLPGLAASLRLLPVGPTTLMLMSGLTIMAAGILMLRVAQTTHGTLRKLALVAIAVAVLLPEYSVDAHFAWVSAYTNSVGQTPLMLAATTGSNRLLMGFGLPVMILLLLLKNRKNQSFPEQGFGVQIVLLFMATLRLHHLHQEHNINPRRFCAVRALRRLCLERFLARAHRFSSRSKGFAC